MSAPDLKAWAVTEDECVELHDTCHEDWNGDNMDHALMANICERVARRRAIAELKALAQEMCQFCGKGTEFAVHPFEPKTRFHNGEDRGFWECQCPEIHDRIAAIEAEE